jgi:hypothetical protein
MNMAAYGDSSVKLDVPDGYGANHHVVRLPYIDMVFSYATLIAFRQWHMEDDHFTSSQNYRQRRAEGNWVMRRNEWGSTTAKHMSYYGMKADQRVGAAEFWRLFHDAMEHPRILLQQVAEEAMESMKDFT